MNSFFQESIVYLAALTVKQGYLEDSFVQEAMGFRLALSIVSDLLSVLLTLKKASGL